MKRASIFMLLGPFLVVMTGMMLLTRAGGTGDVGGILSLALLVLAFPVAAITGALDAWLSRQCPVVPRALLIAIAAAIVAGAPVALLIGLFLPGVATYVALMAAGCMGLCTLLANDYDTGRQSTVSTKA